MSRPLILFGAGASFGSDKPSIVPPLGPALFNALADNQPEIWGKIPACEADAFRCDFEEGMKEYGESHASDGTVDGLQRAMASYFFQFHLRPDSLYLKLAKRIRACEWNGALASINYERLLELSIRNAGLTVVVGGAPEADGGIELCLPNGCCHLFGKIRAPVPAPNLGCPGVPITGAGTQPPVRVVAQVPTILKAGKRTDGTEPTTNLVGPGPGPVDFGHDVRLDSDMVRIIEAPDQHAEELRNSRVPPVMCYFQPDKDTRAGVSFIKDQRQRFADMVNSASVVAIIGVKVRPHDTHIWGPLSKTSAKLIYCAGKDAAPEFDTWSRDAGRTRDHPAFPTYWTDSFDAICQEVGINVVS